MTRLLGLDFADMDADGASAWIAARPALAPFGYVVTPNADHLARLRREPDLGKVYEGAALRLLDSRVVGLAARALGLPAPPVAPGSDVTARLLALSRPRLTIIGSPPAVVAAVTARLRLPQPAHYDPPMGFWTDPVERRRAVAFVLAHPAPVTLLAVGSPRQERLAAAIAATGQATGTGLCIGASLLFLAGAVPRAPAWMRHAGLEWAHRLAHEPRRLARRYLIDSPAVFRLLAQERFG